MSNNKEGNSQQNGKDNDLDIFNICYKNIPKKKKFDFKKLIGKNQESNTNNTEPQLLHCTESNIKEVQSEKKELTTSLNKKGSLLKFETNKLLPQKLNSKSQTNLSLLKKSSELVKINKDTVELEIEPRPSSLKLKDTKQSKVSNLTLIKDIDKTLNKTSKFNFKKGIESKCDQTKFKSGNSSKLSLKTLTSNEYKKQNSGTIDSFNVSTRIPIENKQKSSPPKLQSTISKERKKFTFKKVSSNNTDILKTLVDDNIQRPVNISVIKETKTDLAIPGCSTSLPNETSCDISESTETVDNLMVSFTNTQSLEEDELLARMLDEEEKRKYAQYCSQKSEGNDTDTFLLENIDWDSNWSDEEDKQMATLDFSSSNENTFIEASMSSINFDEPLQETTTSMHNRIDNTAEFRGVFPHTETMKEILHEKFGLKKYRPNQEEIINASLEQHDCFVLMPTGGGKSLCYQLPAILTPGVTIVISPLKALISDQVDKLNALDIPAAHLCSQLKQSESDIILSKLHVREPSIKLLYLTPEKINISMQCKDLLLSLYKRDKLARFVIDEAHCLSHWGHDFRPDYKQLSCLRQQYPKVPIMCLTATATDLVQKDVTSILKLKNPKTFIRSFNRPNIKYIVFEKSGKNVVRDIATLIRKKFEKKSGIIYCLSRNDCEELARDLQSLNIKAMSYHAGMTDNKRETLQRDWMNDKFHVIVATIAFGMGIDKPDVRFVIHNSVPKSVEAFYQESGRCGRDGELSYSYIFYMYGDVVRLQRLIQSERSISKKCLEGHFENLQQMSNYCENKADCRRYLQLRHLGENFDRNVCIRNKLSMCDNCENIKNVSVIDITKECKELAKIVHDIGQRENLTMIQVAYIYKGSMQKKIIEKKYDKHPYFGNGKHHDKVDVHRFLKEMLSEKVLANFCVQSGEFPIVYVKIGPKYSELFNTNKKINISINNIPSTKVPKASTSKAVANNNKNEPEQSTSKLPDYQVRSLKIQCQEELLEVCRTFAFERKVTLSSIMNLAAISMMSELLPNTKEEFMKIQYVTQANYEKFGGAFLAVTQKYRLLLNKMESVKENYKIDDNSDTEWKNLSQSRKKKGTKRKKYRKYYKGRTKKKKWSN